MLYSGYHAYLQLKLLPHRQIPGEVLLITHSNTLNTA